MHRGRRCGAPQQRRFGGRVGEHRIRRQRGLPLRLEQHPAFRQQVGARLRRRLPGHAQMMQVRHGVDDQGARAVPAGEGEVFARVGQSVQVDQVEAGAGAAQYVLDGGVGWQAAARDAHVLQRCDAAAVLGEFLGGGEADREAQGLQRPHVRQDRLRSGIAIRCRHLVVDHQGAPARGARAR